MAESTREIPIRKDQIQVAATVLATAGLAGGEEEFLGMAGACALVTVDGLVDFYGPENARRIMGQLVDAAFVQRANGPLTGVL